MPCEAALLWLMLAVCGWGELLSSSRRHQKEPIPEKVASPTGFEPVLPP